MNIRQLQQFIRVSDTGSISRSALELYISQSALSRSLKNLELEIDAVLLERGVNGIGLTEYGKCFLPYARSIVNEINRAKFDVADLKNGVAGKLSIGVGPTFSQLALPKILQQLQSKRPGITVEITENFIEGLQQKLMCGELDAVLSLIPEDFDAGALKQERLQTFSSVVVAGSEHPLVSKHFVSRQELARCNWVIADQKYARAIFRDYFNRIDIDEPMNSLKTNSVHTIKALVQNSGYISIVPSALVEKEIAAGELATINSRIKPMVSNGALLYNDSSCKSAVLCEFIHLVKEHLSPKEGGRTVELEPHLNQKEKSYDNYNCAV